ncbi:hypothetical protein PAXINDRAFT_19609 [Paxillus involutus ATCC 200175]|uniref:Uncharacterized protein n=1 Tax=Paxillus involutus ATCC 200175 TaxID=664439 RepID=A0A0C9T7R0_PAXIN|nr:hypothetical protein PAXINDRAFT_19609 [Paxillus involutus ATCC 200175]
MPGKVNPDMVAPRAHTDFGSLVSGSTRAPLLPPNEVRTLGVLAQQARRLADTVSWSHRMAIHQGHGVGIHPDAACTTVSVPYLLRQHDCLPSGSITRHSDSLGRDFDGDVDTLEAMKGDGIDGRTLDEVEVPRGGEVEGEY